MKHIVNLFKFIIFCALSVLLFELLNAVLGVIVYWLDSIKYWFFVGILIYGTVMALVPMLGLFIGSFIAQLNSYGSKGAYVVASIILIDFIILSYKIITHVTVWDYYKSVVLSLAWLSILSYLLMTSITATFSSDSTS